MTTTPKALVSINLPASDTPDPLTMAVLSETPMSDRTHLDVLESRRSLFFSDVDMRAEFRLWGGGIRRSMASITGRGPERHAAPSGQVVAVGQSEHLGQHVVHNVMAVDDENRVYGGTITIR